MAAREGRTRPAPAGDLLVVTARWSVVIPAFNEERRLPAYLADVVAYFEHGQGWWEVVVVDDGSADKTSEVVRAVMACHPEVRLIRHATNTGKGFAVRVGMLTAKGDYRLFADADGATPIAELARLESALDGGAAVAIGSRAFSNSGVTVVSRRHRIATRRAFHWVVARLGLRDIGDSQCGFKAFTARAATMLFGPLRTKGFAFDVEILFRARGLGLPVVEVPVTWADQTESKIRPLRDGPAMVLEALIASWHAGRQRRPP